MKALSVTQPYATLIAIGQKRFETRSWATSYRGPLAIHAAAGLGSIGGKRGYRTLCAGEPFRTVLTDHLRALYDLSPSLRDFAYAAIPFGAIVATCRLVDCWRTTDVRLHDILTDQEGLFGDYRDGRWAWVLADVQPLLIPIPMKGALRLWEADLPTLQAAR